MPSLPLIQGTLDLLILQTLTAGPMHGYAVARRIQQLTDDALSVEEGSLYPALHRMQQRGWVKSEWAPSENNRRAKYYRLAPAGRRQLASEAESWSRFVQAVGRVLHPRERSAGA